MFPKFLMAFPERIMAARSVRAMIRAMIRAMN
jgi:hypothetical protein